jgi:two-component system chemotaxis response regulator CheY
MFSDTTFPMDDYGASRHDENSAKRWREEMARRDGAKRWREERDMQQEMPLGNKSPQAMVVDDSRAMRLILSRALQGFGYEVAQAVNGKDALEKLHQESSQVSLFLVDWNMPEMNGLEFVKNLRAEHRFDSTPVVMVTTETEADQMTLALEAGANEYVIKPFTSETIEDKLRMLGLLG